MVGFAFFSELILKIDIDLVWHDISTIDLYSWSHTDGCLKKKRQLFRQESFWYCTFFFLSHHIEDTIMKPFIPRILKSVYHIYLCNKDQTDDASALGWFEISILDILN